MQYKKFSYYALLLIAITIIACGGGEDKSASAPGTPAPSAAAPSGNTFDASKATATVNGKVTFDGTAPQPAKLPLTPECKQIHEGEAVDQSVELNADGTLKDVLVYVKSGAENWTFPPATEPVILDQVGCQYKPHVIAVMANQPIKIRNSDPFLHNIHPLPKNNPQFNLGQPVKGMETEKSFANPEVAIPVKCDVHRWMSSYIAVLGHPLHNITGDSGSYTIKLPAGTYTLEAWHEKFGAQTQNVTVTDNQTQEVNFAFKAS